MLDHLLCGFVFASIVALMSYRARLLTVGGALTQCVLGTLLLGLGGWQWTVPIVVFFLSSSLFSRLWRSQRSGLELIFQKGSVRDAVQVLANGGVAAAAVVFWTFTHNAYYYAAYLGAVAAATADTWGTEIGTLSRTPPRLITSLKPVERGRSGAISLLGTFAAVAGSVLIGLSAVAWLEQTHSALLVSVAGGIGGMFVDSLLGATLQLSYRCSVCDRYIEKRVHCGTRAVRVGGLGFINNDVINLLCTLLGALISGFVSTAVL